MNGRRDEGAVLPLVLVMMVIAALLVVPLLSYSVSVLRANQVVGEATRNREAAEAGLRVALLDPTRLFAECSGSSKPLPGPAGGVVDGVSVSTSCSMTEEVGPLNVLGFPNPVGTTVAQVGASVPASFVGTKATPPTTATHDWWNGTPTATDAQIWMPTLPAQPQTIRTGPFAMPAAYQCTVYLPGRYPDPLTITTGNVYFASGVYWFEDQVTFSGDANVVVGYGLAELPTECADDLQVGSNLVGAPGAFDIDGAGATWVFGGDGRLVIDNSATSTGLSVEFNQRYVEPGFEADRGQRISIMSVNGDDTSPADHVVPGVVRVPRSKATVNQAEVQLGQPGAEYLPTSSRFTSEPIPPAAPADVDATAHTTAAAAPDQGAVLLEWDEVTGAAAGGALIDAYRVTWTSTPGPATPTTVCDPAEIVSTSPGRLACAISGLRIDRPYQFSVVATNSAGASPVAVATVNVVASAPALAAPDAPIVTGYTAYDDAVEVAWTAGASDGGAPVTGYIVTVQRVTSVPAPTPPADDDDDDDDDGDDDGDDDDGGVPPVMIEQYETVGTCATGAQGGQPAATRCVATVTGDGAPNIGYRFVVTAVNAIGTSAETIDTPVPAVLTFDGPSVPAPADPPVQVVVPRVPDPIIDLRLGGTAPATISIPGYVSVPMSRVSVDNPHRHDVRIIGGLLTSTIHVDSTAASAAPESMMLGYQSEIVLQRRLTLVATAGNVVARAVVQINEDGNYAVNSWVVQ